MTSLISNYPYIDHNYTNSAPTAFCVKMKCFVLNVSPELGREKSERGVPESSKSTILLCQGMLLSAYIP